MLNLFKKQLTEVEKLENIIQEGIKTLERANKVISEKYYEIEQMKEINVMIVKNLEQLHEELEEKRKKAMEK